MKTFQFYLLTGIFVTLTMGFTTPVQATIPAIFGYVTNDIDTDHTLYCLPDGTGASFSQAHLADGTVHDATITIEIRTEYDYAVPDLPVEDMWLESVTGGLVTCTHGTTPDSNTDMYGKTQWTAPLRAGGFSQDDSDLCQVMLAGAPVSTTPPFPLYFNSADMNGDLVVDILDIVAFQFQVTNGYHRSIDLDYDGVIDILDVTRLTTAWLAGCD